jgi:hypothetical protein
MIANRAALFLLLSTLVTGSALAASDVITVATVTASGSTVNVPVSIRDASGTALGMDQAPPARIQSFSFKVTYAPASAVSSVTFSRAGITASLTPTSEFKPATADTTSLLATFRQSTNPIPFTLNAAAGNVVAEMSFTLSPSATPGTVITLTLDPSVTQLTDEGAPRPRKSRRGTAPFLWSTAASPSLRRRSHSLPLRRT